MKILNTDSWIQDRIQNSHTESFDHFADSLETVKKSVEKLKPPMANTETTIVPMTGRWVNSEGYVALWKEINELREKVSRNADQFDPSAYYDLINKIRIDITRRRYEYVDLTTVIATQISNPSFSKIVSLDEFLPYGLAFVENDLRGTDVELGNQNYGGTGSVTMQGYAVGYVQSLENALFNTDIASIQRLNEALARGYVAKRNDLSAGVLIGATYVASQTVAADSTGSSNEDKLYKTIDNAIETLTNLLDPQTGQLIRTGGGLVALVNPGDIRRINRAINGQINDSKGAPINRTPLTEIAQLVPYFGDSIKMGKKVYSYTGVAKNTMYLFVPGTAWILEKRGLTPVMSEGRALNLGQEEFAWYFVQTSYFDEMLGSSAAGTALGAGYGYIVKVTLPT